MLQYRIHIPTSNTSHCVHCSSNHKPNLYDDDDDDDGDNEDSSSDEMDFKEREPETAVQQDMITLDLSQ